MSRSGVLLALMGFAVELHGETGRAMWLRYAPLDAAAQREYRTTAPFEIFVAGHSPILLSARDELVTGLRGMLGRTPRIDASVPQTKAILVGAVDALNTAKPKLGLPQLKNAGEFWMGTRGGDTVIAGADERGVLYGVFAYLRRISTEKAVNAFEEHEAPYASIRWVNQWDNLDGTIERGYGGRSIFWENNLAREDLTRVQEYARFLASLGIDACAVNNVNASPVLLQPAFFAQIARIADAMRPWGVRVAISVDFASPKSIGGMTTFDPVDGPVAAWWKERVDALYGAVPDLAGFVMKADSEGRAGPSTYGRSHADAANVVARALKPHGGLLFYRGFVYNHHMDWRDPNNDRAKAAYDNFKPLDGKFDDNVVVQIKNGPIDFQVREPASPLFGALEHTNQALELQVTQEYVGQARHLVFLAPQWKQALDFDEQAGRAGTPVKALAAGKVFGRPAGGFAGVVNVGLDDNWFGSDLSQANLYAFGRLAWNPDLAAKEIADEWTRQTFGSDPLVLGTMESMLMRSWRAYENYSGPFGLQTLTDIVGNHYGVAVEASEANGWGQWHRADAGGVGMDRTAATGTGYASQYRGPVARMWESVSMSPDDLILFFHHVPYTYKLHSGKTVIQAIYDAHYDGAATAAGFPVEWAGLEHRADDARYAAVMKLLRYQAGSADVWRDAVNNWFHRASGIADEHGRVGRSPGRTEAEAMQLTGYQTVDVTPWETASGGKAVSCSAAKCAAAFPFRGAPGWYTIRVQYFDQNDGSSHFALFAGEQRVDAWDASDHLPTRKLDGTSSVRRETGGILLHAGDAIRIEGTPDGGEPAAFDYVDILPEAGWDARVDTSVRKVTAP